MALSRKSAGGPVFATSSAAPTGVVSKSTGRERDWIDNLTNTQLVQVTLGFIQKMGAQNASAIDLCAVGARVTANRPQFAAHLSLILDIDELLADRCYEISARECVELLAQRLNVNVSGGVRHV